MRTLLALLACIMSLAVGHAAEQHGNLQLVLVNLQGQKKLLGSLPDAVGAPRVSPDGKQVTFDLADKVYVAELDNLEQRRALPQTIVEPRNLAPIWSHDALWVVFQGSGNGSDDLFLARVNANITEQPRYIGDGRSPEGIDNNGWVIFLTRTGEKDYGIAQLDPATRKVTRLIDQPGSAQYSSAIAPDGRWIAYTSDETGRPQVWLEPLPITGQRLQLTQSGGSHPQWSPDGKRIYFDEGGQLYQMAIATSGEPQAGDPQALPISGFVQTELRRQYDLLPDGTGFVMLFPAAAAGQ